MANQNFKKLNSGHSTFWKCYIWYTQGTPQRKYTKKEPVHYIFWNYYIQGGRRKKR